MYGYKSWTTKKAECRRIDAFELWYWRRLLRVPWTAKRSHQSIPVLNIHWKDWCWSWSSNTLATWCEELTHWKRPWCWKILKSSGEGDKTGWCGWMASPTLWTWIWASSGSGDQQRSLACCSLWGRKESHTTEQLNWIDREYQAYGVGSLTFQLGDTYPVQVFWNSAGLIVLSFLSNYWNNLEKAQWRDNSNTLGTDRVVSPWAWTQGIDTLGMSAQLTMLPFLPLPPFPGSFPHSHFPRSMVNHDHTARAYLIRLVRTKTKLLSFPSLCMQMEQKLWGRPTFGNQFNKTDKMKQMYWKKHWYSREFSLLRSQLLSGAQIQSLLPHSKSNSHQTRTF